VYTPECLCMFFRVVSFLGKFVEQVTSSNTWNSCLEKALEYVVVIIEICTVFVQSLNFLNVIAASLGTAIF
jgi:hypothetical protein